MACEIMITERDRWCCLCMIESNTLTWKQHCEGRKHQHYLLILNCDNYFEAIGERDKFCLMCNAKLIRSTWMQHCIAAHPSFKMGYIVVFSVNVTCHKATRVNMKQVPVTEASNPQPSNKCAPKKKRKQRVLSLCSVSM